MDRDKLDKDMVVKAYKRYIREIGKSGGSDRLLIASAKIGQIAWEQSCKSTEDGACVRIKRERATRNRKKGKKRRKRCFADVNSCGESQQESLVSMLGCIEGE